LKKLKPSIFLEIEGFAFADVFALGFIVGYNTKNIEFGISYQL